MARDTQQLKFERKTRPKSLQTWTKRGRKTNKKTNFDVMSFADIVKQRPRHPGIISYYHLHVFNQCTHITSSAQ